MLKYFLQKLWNNMNDISSLLNALYLIILEIGGRGVKFGPPER